MQTKNRQKLLLILALSAVGLFLGDRLLLRPLTKLWSSRASRIAQLRQDITAGQTLLERQQVIRTRWEQMRRQALPSNPSATEQQVFKAVDGWAQESRVNVTAVLPQWRKEAGNYTTYQCRVDAAGTIASLSRFLYSVERDPMPLKVESIEIGTSDKQGQQLGLALQFSGLVLNLGKQ
jgi:hypothetical protein